MAQYPIFTGRVTRLAFFDATHNAPHELIVEMVGNDQRTFVAYGHSARTLRNFLIQGKTYTIDYDPTPGSTFDGEVFSARDRN